MSTPVDVLVIGGGPAGATAAGLLASWGRSVALIHHESSKPSLAESLPASTRKLLRFLGQLEEVDSAGFHPNHGNISRWAGKEARAESADAGYHVSRSVFDRVLRAHARAQGASIVEGRVQRVDFVGDGPPCRLRPTTAVTLECATSRGVGRYQASFVLDCSGRAGIIARRGLRRADAGYRTLAIAAEWECPDWPSHEQTHTVVDSYENGWAWSVPLSAARRQCTVMVDADLMTVRKASLDAIYRGELRKAPSIGARLTGSREINRPWACDASLYTCQRAADSAALLVGDAASFIEPLSSAGVKKALASAWRTAVVVNTALDKPQMLAVATDYHDRREREVYQECLRRSAEFFKTAANVHGDEFWSVRASVVPDTDGAAGLEGSALHDARVRAAFDLLRDASSLELAPAPHLRFEPFAVIEDREVVLRDAIVLPGISEPVRYVGGVNLPELVRIAAGCRDVPSLIESYHHRVGPVDPRDLLVGLSVLIAGGLMRSEVPLQS